MGNPEVFKERPESGGEKYLKRKLNLHDRSMSPYKARKCGGRQIKLIRQEYESVQCTQYMPRV
jgi:hypothetical protein